MRRQALFGIGGDKELISLDWDARLLRVVQWKISKGVVRALKSAVVDIPSTVNIKDTQSMGRFIMQSLDELRIRTQLAIVDVPRDQTVLNTMSLPRVGVNELAGMVQLQIAKELPFPLSDAVVDFAVGENDHDDHSCDVLVAAIRNEMLSFYKTVCESAGLKLERVGLRPYANMVAVHEMLGTHSGRIMYVDIGPTLTEIGVLRDGSLAFSRAASVHLDEVEHEDALATEDEYRDVNETASDNDQQIVQSLLVEITRSAEAYRSTDPGAHFDHIIVAGSSGLEQRVAERIGKRFGTEPRIYDPTSVVNSKKHSGTQLQSLAAVVGLGAGHAGEGRLHFDFLHPKKPMDAAARRKKYIPYVSAASIALLFIGSVAYGIGIYPYQVEIEAYDQKIAKQKALLKDFKEIEYLAKGAERWQALQLAWPDELRRLRDILPSAEDAHIVSSMEMNRGKGSIKFDLVAKKRADITSFLTRLENVSKPDKSGEAMFKVVRTNIVQDSTKHPEYPYKTSVTIHSKRILELLDQGKKRR